MNRLEPLYLSYTELDGHTPYFQVLEGSDGLELVRTSAPIMGHVATLLHIRGRADDRPIEVVVVSSERIDEARARDIDQKAINYAMERGFVPFRRSGVEQ